jgi:hypothetical protein
MTLHVMPREVGAVTDKVTRIREILKCLGERAADDGPAQDTGKIARWEVEAVNMLVCWGCTVPEISAILHRNTNSIYRWLNPKQPAPLCVQSSASSL